MRRGWTQARARLLVLLTVALAAAVTLAGAASGCGGSAGSAAAGSPAAAVAGIQGDGGPSSSPKAGAQGVESPASPRATPSSRQSPSARSTPSSRPSASSSPAGPTLRVVFVDVGQGDAAALRSGSWSGLVDGGPRGSEAAVSAALSRLGVRRLDVLVISHLHADHTGGLPSIIRRYRPRKVWVSGKAKGDLAAALHAVGAEQVQARSGLTARFGRSKARVLAPDDLAGDPNRDSIVLLLQAAGRRVLLTGDSTGAGEVAAGERLARGPPLDVLKVSHHGSRYSTTRGFVSAARPRAAVISVGANSYGHPTDEVVQRLRSAGARVVSTQRNGSVTLTVTSGGELRWAYSRSSKAVVRGVTAGSSAASSSATAGSVAGSASSSSAGGPSGAKGQVYVTRTGERYHRAGCRYLSASRIAITLARAKAKGYRACKVCDPPR